MKMILRPHSTSIATLCTSNQSEMQRQSNIELLRIVSMLLILVVHIDGASLGLPTPMGNIASLSLRDWWKLIIESFSIIGVNCFVLISGYFGIKASWKGFVRLSLYCLFYSIAIYCIVAIGIKGDWSWIGLAESFMIYTHTDLWFVPAYLGLFLLAPFLNKSVESLSIKQFSIWLSAFITFNIYVGWCWGGRFNPTGYTVLHLVMIYLIGRYINLFMPKIKHLGLYSTIIWISSTALILISSLFLKSTIAFAYNSPFVILASISFFMMFKSLTFSSKMINYCATSAFAVYLIHKNPLVWIDFTGWIKKMWQELSLPTFTLFVIGISLAIFYICIAIDQSRRYLMRLLKL